ncbi:MAG: ABC transporter ATP-binding protein [Alphaproteobacteria bacterium]|nr:ABC transporter ATP-binding protein [Alphaproteobacteria bacterium]
MSTPAAVEFTNVSRRFGPVVAVDSISFRVEPGTLVTLLGPSGCGKTTTLRMIAGLEMPSDGAIRIGERDVTRVSAAERDVSMVFQSYALFPHMNVLENVGYGLAVSPMTAAQRDEKARAFLRKVGLEGYEKRQIGALSGGQQQRVALARALVLEPQVLLFDEPLSNLDAKLRRRMRDEIRDLQRELGITAVYVTHDQEEAMAVSDKIVVMKDGHIAQMGTPDELYEAPVDRFVADFIGGANLIDCEIAGVEGDTARVAVGGTTLSQPARGLRSGPATLAIRYAAVRLQAGGAGALTGTVRKATYLGSHREFTIDSPIGELFVIEPDLSNSLTVGAPVAITFRDRGLALVAR